jgi:carbonyl reductase 1
MEQQQGKVIIVTGANQGIGLAIVDQLSPLYPKSKIILTSRDPSRGEKARQSIIAKHSEAQNNVIVQKLDIRDPKSREDFFNEIKAKYGHIDVLINNAASYTGNNGGFDTYDTIVRTNYHATIDFTEKLLPLLSDDGRVIMVSSGLGKLANQNPAMQELLNNPLSVEQINSKLKELEKASAEGKEENLGLRYPLYSTSKAFLNAYLRWVLTSKLKTGQSAIAMCPGYCKTQLNDFQGVKPPEEGAKPAVYLVGLTAEKAKELNAKFINEHSEVQEF